MYKRIFTAGRRDREDNLLRQPESSIELVKVMGAEVVSHLMVTHRFSTLFVI